MAVQAHVSAARMRIKYLGDIVNEKQTFITKTYSNLNPLANDEDIYEVSGILSAFQTKALYNICKLVDTELVDE